ncbi:MAG: signal recognition particle subunit SRP54 [Myxococcota bacterium]|jgi:signal recognition particle subunit SRP54
MLETVSKGFKAARNRLKGYREITEENIDEAVRDIRISLLEADVEFNVVKAFLARVKEKALGEIVKVKAKVEEKGAQKVTPGDHFVKICLEELTDLMGPVDTAINYAPSGITGVMMVGLQGSGKTTTAAKLARLIEKDGKRPMLVAADVYRPAAIAQLKVLGEKLNIPVYDEGAGNPVDICRNAVVKAKAIGRNVVIFDTAGRLSIDEPLMAELDNIVRDTKPHNIYLVIDAMIGQDAVQTARTFNERLDVDGVILTKLDGDARGGAALSVKAVTGKPIKFVGMGEGLDKLEEFRPEGIATRILGLGDVVGLMKEFEEIVDEEKADEDARKILSGNFSLVQFLDQIKTIQKLGPIKEVFEKLPFGDMPAGMDVNDKQLRRVEAMISSMTKQEREKPEVIDDSRMNRIANGSGVKKTEVKDLLQRFFGMRQLMGQVGKQPSLLGKIPGFKQLAQLQNIQGLDMDELMGGDMAGAMGGQGMPGMPPGMMPDEGAARGPRAGQRRQVSAGERAKAKSKKKMAAKSRKKSKKKK